MPRPTLLARLRQRRRARRVDDSALRVAARFMVVSLLALVLVAVLEIVLQRRQGTREATRSAEELAELTARAIVAPMLASLSPSPDELDRLDRAVRQRVLSENVVRVKVWAADGRVVYSDEPALVGSTYALAEDDQAALLSGDAEAELSDLSRPENRFERKYDKLLEVYVGARARDGTPMLVEIYHRYTGIASSGRRLWLTFTWPPLAALVLLWLILGPLAYSMARRLRASRQEREQLLGHAIVASNLERRRIAADLHDGTMQKLAATHYGLSAARIAAEGTPTADEIDAAIASLRESMHELRFQIVQVRPPFLERAGLAKALGELVAPLPALGIEPVVSVDREPRLPAEGIELLFRAAQEAIRNVVAHAGASRVAVDVAEQEGLVVLRVEDDGRGVDDEERARRRDEGHVGLVLLEELAHDLGGRVEIVSRPGAGTTLRLELPVRQAGDPRA